MRFIRYVVRLTNRLGSSYPLTVFGAVVSKVPTRRPSGRFVVQGLGRQVADASANFQALDRALMSAKITDWQRDEAVALREWKGQRREPPR